MKDLILNLWWAAVVVVVAVLEYGHGKKRGRRIGYAEGHANGRQDALRELGVPARAPEAPTVELEVGKSFIIDLRGRRGGGRS